MLSLIKALAFLAVGGHFCAIVDLTGFSTKKRSGHETSFDEQVREPSLFHRDGEPEPPEKHGR